MMNGSPKARRAAATSPWSEKRIRSDKGRARKRDVLLRTAARLFITEGFHTTSLDRLAESLGITKPTLYYYFKDKDDILFRCEEIAATRVLQWITEALDAEGPSIDRLMGFFRKYILAVTDDYLRCFILIEEAALSDVNRRRIRRSERRINNMVRDLVERGIADGSIAPCDSQIATFTMFGSANWVAHWYKPEGDLTSEQIADRMTGQFVSGLVRRADPYTAP